MASLNKVHLLVIADKSSPELQVLSTLPSNVEIVAIGKPNELDHLTLQQWDSISILLNFGTGVKAARKEDIQAIWSKLHNLKWMHSTIAGLEHLLFDELIQSSVILTNAKGVYKNSLSEFALMACKYFALDMPRLLRAKRERKWEPFTVEELRGKTMGIAGCGAIGFECGQLAKAYQMKVLGLRRKVEMTPDEADVVDKMYRPDQICELMSMCDYVVVSTPYTPDTHHLVSAEAIAAMKPNAVLVNVGRGKCINETALIEALKRGFIRGAAMDVYEVAPLPFSSDLWEMENVLLSTYCAGLTKECQTDSMSIFMQNIERYLMGAELVNVCDKRSGY